MPPTLTYPGVYIEEIPSGVRTITGVATSITAFIGRARRGPTDRPRLVQSFAEFERTYGGLWLDSTMSFAVQHYFLNGGRDALICRVQNGGAAAALNVAVGAATFGLVARSEGEWGNRLRARFEDADPAPNSNEGANSKFNLIVKDLGTQSIERFLNLSTDPNHPRYVTNVLRDQSNLVRIAGAGTVPANRPPASGAAPAGQDPLDVNPSSAAFGQGGSAGQAGNDGNPLVNADIAGAGLEANRQGMWLLEHADLVNIISIPPVRPDLEVAKSTWDAAIAYATRRRAMVIVDSPDGWGDVPQVTAGLAGVADPSANAAIYFPRVRVANPLREGRLETFAACGVVAGIWARTDSDRGVWKAPAGLDATLVGVSELPVNLTDGQNGQLNPLGVNCLRSFPVNGRVVWGARTLRGADQMASEWKYVPVRRMALFLEESLYRGTQWVVFEPNDEPLWAQIRLNVGAFMQNLFRQGAFQGSSPREAYFVKCDRETTTQNDINLGIVNIRVGFAPLKPAEFVVISIQQMAGQVAA
jgi:phage tail sheath protein FI